MKQIERNRTWFLTIGLAALLGLGIVWGSYALTFLQPFAEELNPLEPLDLADYQVDVIEFLQPLDEGIIGVALNENKLIEQWRDELWSVRSVVLPGKDLTPTPDRLLTPSPTLSPTETRIMATPTPTSSPTQVAPPSATQLPTDTPQPTETSTVTPAPTLVPTNTLVPTPPPPPTNPPKPTIIVIPPTITPTQVFNQTDTPKFGS